MLAADILVSLPSVLKTRIVSYLGHRDAIRLSQTSKAFHYDVRISSLSPPYELIYSQIWLGETMTGDVPCRAEMIPIFSSHPHSITLTCRWRDQGWGERKGRLYIVSETPNSQDKDKDSSPEKDLFSGGQVVCESPLASHEFTTLELSFAPKRNQVYYTWYRCGGGGGHLLMLENLVVHTLVFDDNEKSMGTIYSRLSKLGILDLGGNNDDGGDDDDEFAFGENNSDIVFYTKLLIKVVESFLQEVNEGEPFVPYSILKSFLELNGLQVNPASLLSMRSVCHFFLQYVDHQTPLCMPNRGTQEEIRSEHNLQDEPPTPDQQPEDPTEAVLPPFTLIPYATWEGDADSGDIPLQCTRIPLLHGYTKSVRLTCQWKDEGYDSSKGQLFVIAKNADSVPSHRIDQDSLPFDGGRVVWKSPTVSHELSSLNMSFFPREDEIYFLFQKPGGEHLIHIEDLMVHMTVLDDGALAQALKNLLKCGALNRRDEDRSFNSRLLVAATAGLLQAAKDGYPQTTALATFFESNGFPIHSRALRPLQEMLQCLIEFNDQRDAGTFTSSSNDVELRFWTHAAM